MQYETEFILQELYEVCPQYLVLHNEYNNIDEQLADNLLKRKYVKCDPVLKELYEVAPQYLTKEHIVTDSGILVEVNEVKYLGINIDNSLTFQSHISDISQKVSKVTGVLWKARHLPLSIKLKIYYSLVYTHINYAILVWGSIISKNLTWGTTNLHNVPNSLKNLNTIHNKSVRALVCARRRDPLSKIYRDLNLLKLIDIYYYNLATFAHECFTGNSPNFFSDYPTSHRVAPIHITRSLSTKSSAFDFTCDKIHYNQPQFTKTLNSVNYAAAALWNKLPLSLKQSKSTSL